jgi:hypothetical protein
VSDVQQAAVPAAGWYPDPAGGGSSRWWSGDAWTDHVQPAVAAAVPVRLFADGGFDPAVLTPPAAGPSSQEDWHASTGRATSLQRTTGGSVSLSVQAPAAGTRHDPYGQRNWAAGLALVLALLAIPALGWRAVAELPPLTQSIFAGAPIAVALLALVLAIRRGRGMVLSIVSLVISGAALAGAFLVDPAALREITENVLALIPA